jgi:hypothetical protein
MAIDTNTAQKQKGFDLIPTGTVCSVVLNLRGLKDTNARDGKMLDCEYTVSSGDFSTRKIWELSMISGNGGEGHTTAVDISMSRLRAFLESAFAIESEDESEEAQAARVIEDWTDIDGLEVLVKIGVEKSKDPQYPDKNRIVAFVGPDSKDWEEFGPDWVEQNTRKLKANQKGGGGKPAAAKGKAAPAAKAKADAGTTTKPNWAKK